MDIATARLNQIIPARAPWSAVLRIGETLRIIDLEGQQSADTLIYNAHDTGERYSCQETLLAQGSAYITTGAELLSNEGRALMRLTADTVGRHDTSAGACSCEANTVRFGHHTRHMHACRENFIIAATRHGMTKRDIVPNINFFMNVPILPDGTLAIDDGISTPGGYVDLRAEMDVIVLISNCPQVNNPCNGFNPTPLQAVIWPPDSWPSNAGPRI